MGGGCVEKSGRDQAGMLCAQSVCALLGRCCGRFVERKNRRCGEVMFESCLVVAGGFLDATG
jgi:hypothetical protein